MGTRIEKYIIFVLLVFILVACGSTKKIIIILDEGWNGKYLKLTYSDKVIRENSIVKYNGALGLSEIIEYNFEQNGKVLRIIQNEEVLDTIIIIDTMDLIILSNEINGVSIEVKKMNEDKPLILY